MIRATMLAACLGALAAAGWATEKDRAFKTDIRILLEDSHDQSRVPGPQYNFGQTYLHEMFVKSGAMVDTTTGAQGKARKPLSLPFLRQYDLVISHGKYNTGPTVRRPFSNEEIEAVGQYVEQGGFFVVIAGNFLPKDHPEFYNPLLKQFGIAVTNDPAPWTVRTGRDMEDPLIDEVPVIYPLAGSTLQITHPTPRVLAEAGGKPVLAFVSHGDGFVIVVGGGSAWMNQGFAPRENDTEPRRQAIEANTRLMSNLLRWVEVCRLRPAPPAGK